MMRDLSEVFVRRGFRVVFVSREVVALSNSVVKHRGWGRREPPRHSKSVLPRKSS